MTRHPSNDRPTAPSARPPGRTSRRRVLAAFRALGHGVDPATARGQTETFYRSRGTAWARALG